MGAAVEHVHHRHRQQVRLAAAVELRQIAIERLPGVGAAALAAASETPRIALAPSRPLFGVPSSSIIVSSRAPCSAARAPVSAAAISPLTFSTARETPLPAQRCRRRAARPPRTRRSRRPTAPRRARERPNRGHLDLDRRIAARVEDLARVDGCDGAHGRASLSRAGRRAELFGSAGGALRRGGRLNGAPSGRPVAAFSARFRLFRSAVAAAPAVCPSVPTASPSRAGREPAGRPGPGRLPAAAFRVRFVAGRRRHRRMSAALEVGAALGHVPDAQKVAGST